MAIYGIRASSKKLFAWQVKSKSSREYSRGSILKIESTLSAEDFKTCREWLRLSSEEFSEQFDLLDEYEQKKLQSILETYRLDILDAALEFKIKI